MVRRSDGATSDGSVGAAMRRVRLREVRGEDEIAELSASELVSRLRVGGGHDLSLPEQDRAVVDIYKALYGEEVQCHVQCGSCHRGFEMSFSLNDWLASLAGADPHPPMGPDGTIEFSDGLRFRLPREADLDQATGRDEAEVAASLRRLCVIEGDADDPRLETAMASIGPLLDDEVEAECPHCARTQPIQFRLQDYLLASLARERPLVLREVHYVARTYRWSRSEILAMPRSQRREHVALILADAIEGEGSWAG